MGRGDRNEGGHRERDEPLYMALDRQQKRFAHIDSWTRGIVWAASSGDAVRALCPSDDIAKLRLRPEFPEVCIIFDWKSQSSSLRERGLITSG